MNVLLVTRSDDNESVELVRHALKKHRAKGVRFDTDHYPTSVGLSTDRPLDARKLNEWLSGLLQSKGGDLYRTKGILSFDGVKERYVFQGVHMLLDSKADVPWKPNEKRVSQLVFIGKDLDRAELERGFLSCVK